MSGRLRMGHEMVTEALIEDLRVIAPHVRVALVTPRHVGTGIVANSGRAPGRDDADEANEAFGKGVPLTVVGAATIM